MKVSNKRSQGGFTLVEMSVVLLVIGLIIGAVSIGKDMQRNADRNGHFRHHAAAGWAL